VFVNGNSDDDQATVAILFLHGNETRDLDPAGKCCWRQLVTNSSLPLAEPGPGA
jgi:hypothetical protein